MTQKEFMEKQCREIELAKYYEGIRIGRDPGEEFVRKWIAESAAKYRDDNCDLIEDGVLPVDRVRIENESL